MAAPMGSKVSDASRTPPFLLSQQNRRRPPGQKKNVPGGFLLQATALNDRKKQAPTFGCSSQKGLCEIRFELSGLIAPSRKKHPIVLGLFHPLPYQLFSQGDLLPQDPGA